MGRQAFRYNHFILLAEDKPGTLISVLNRFEATCSQLVSITAKHVAGTDSLAIRIIDDKLDDLEARSIVSTLKSDNGIRSAELEQVIKAA
ncbi:hypothetical protein GCM10017044_02620 [Kordiimonas sediminis]|uniref:ACT domain-containing protein n=1 Tax=Kordiimonas sediminis TaxID=1735581 RepID=A0A919E499_9PROT|nr:hypothetical protein [Kordiimonas sediminis]GHF12179.1 hypothetical protein GCM10017044_02620 [Kordiimonas sediminis]